MRVPFCKSQVRRSKHNGLVLVNEGGEVLAFGAKQTSARYAELWSDAFAQSAPLLRREVKNVLMLGLAGGGALPAVYNAYPGCRITAVEYDPVMVEIAQELMLNGPHPFPVVIVEDAAAALKNITEAFDVILVDIFKGLEPSDLVSDSVFWDLVKKRLAHGGIAILNVAVDSDKAYAAKAYFAHSKTWQHGANTFCTLSD